VTEPLLIPLPGNEHLVAGLAKVLGAEVGGVAIRRFPDGETYLRYEAPVSGRSLMLVCTLDRPDDKFLPLVFAAAAAHDLGVTRVGLVCPYLAYMRQDRRFQPGEAVTSGYFAKLLSSQIDWLVTVDPHLHRRAALAEIYSIPTQVMHAAPLISDWIRKEVSRPLLIGPDSESEQRVAAVARDAGAAHVDLQKVRRGDRDVDVSVPDVARWRDHTPVLVDDIVSTARTMIETVSHLKRESMRPPVCIAVHGIFAGDAYGELMAAGASRVVTTSTVPHATNAIDIAALLAQGVQAVAKKPAVDRPRVD
jgi:ribose-phosphate pyrophosphokinase